MSLGPGQLKCIPLLHEFSDGKLAQLASVFKRRDPSRGELLFEAGKLADEVYLLTEGEITIYEGDQVRMKLIPPVCIGEVGTLAGMNRNTTARISKDTEIWCASREDLLGFFQTHSDIAQGFYQRLVDLLAHKVRRDQLRLSDMRVNIIRTQKAMKAMREMVLHTQDTPISGELYDTLDDLIAFNRRVNYRIAPPSSLPAFVRLDDKSMAPVAQISRTHVSIDFEGKDIPDEGSHMSGVLCLGAAEDLQEGEEIPISGEVLRAVGERVDLELDLLMEEYSQALDNYLTRIQMVDFMV